MLKAQGSATETIPRDTEIMLRTKLGTMTSQQLNDVFYGILAIEGPKS